MCNTVTSLVGGYRCFGVTHRLFLQKGIPAAKHHVMQTYEGVEVQLHVFLTSAVDAAELLAPCTDRFTRRYSLDGREDRQRAVAKRKPVPCPGTTRTTNYMKFTQTILSYKMRVEGQAHLSRRRKTKLHILVLMPAVSLRHINGYFAMTVSITSGAIIVCTVHCKPFDIGSGCRFFPQPASVLSPSTVLKN